MRLTRALCGYLLCASLLVVTALPAHAEILEDLYKSQVSVNTQTGQERSRALREAFKQTLARVSNISDWDNVAPAIDRALADVDTYLIQYAYTQHNGQTFLQAEFDETKITALLRSAQLPIWGKRRPQLMLWMAVESRDGERKILASDSESIFTQQLRNQATIRGVPMALPLMDLRDAMAVSLTDVWGRFISPIRRASERYDVDGVVVGRLLYQPEQQPNWRLNWYLEIGNERLHGQIKGNDPDYMAVPLVDDIGNRLAQQFSVRTDAGEASQLIVEIEGLDSLADVLNVESFLKSIAAVQRVQLEQYGHQQGRFKLWLLGSAERVYQAIDLDGRLTQHQRSPFAMPETLTANRYVWSD
ncbi:DUF2066 domain-containing protein [Idiomarina tyrosinivorans]|uniref:DUF2066 domain-containing protein n=1 Tax=Idiomarina tyrosinivorans TaxID=1445662 RepID=A0A432ZUF3_9GAMM|nr:DUF2066 domain-containing protein [Idiomarina tyrosinivorans]RUO81472.1 DUF2066 domain-containing protein [Idiomarina tyrosinivorans]